MYETAVDDDPLIGKQLANFRLERVIGRGGMAVVYYGVDIKLNRPVAVKVIDARYRHNPAYAERFVRESQVVATWRHPNILNIYYADDQDALYYFVMEYIEGMDLREVVTIYEDEGQLMPLADVLNIGAAVADALDYAHRQGVIHRDIKPSNIMVSKDGRVLLTDFGLALQVTDGSIGEVFGTPHYMAPEQARRSADAVPQSDIYSLGVILYELLTGSVPFDDQSPTSIALQHVTQLPPSPRSFNPNLNEATERVLLKALEKEPAHRFQSGRELINTLREALELARDDAGEELPPIPASMQRRKPGPLNANALPTISDITVSERVALQLQTRHLAPTEKDPPARPQRQPASTSSAQRQSWLPFALALAAVFILLLGGWALAGGNGRSVVATPTSAAAANLAQPTATPLPSIIPTATPTSPSTPTATATAVPPTVTAVPPTITAVPPTPSQAAPVFTAPTATREPSILLIYDRNGLYILNLTDRIIDLGPLAFSALKDGTRDTFYSLVVERDWPFYRIRPQFCGGVEISGTSPSRPSRCEGFDSLTFPGINAKEYFWSPDRLDEGIDSFRVSWYGDTVRTCQIPDGFCLIPLP